MDKGDAVLRLEVSRFWSQKSERTVIKMRDKLSQHWWGRRRG